MISRESSRDYCGRDCLSTASTPHPSCSQCQFPPHQVIDPGKIYSVIPHSAGAKGMPRNAEHTKGKLSYSHNNKKKSERIGGRTMHWTLSFSVALRRFPFSSFSMVAFCVGCGVCPTNMFCQANCPVLYVPVLLTACQYRSSKRRVCSSTEKGRIPGMREQGEEC